MIFDEKTLKTVVDCFVLVYGEKYRNNITEKINNCLILLCGYKSQKEREELKKRINQKYLIVFIKESKQITNLTYEELIFLFGNDCFENSDRIGSFSSLSQKIIDMDSNTRASKINKKQILQTRNEFLNLFSKNIDTNIADKLIELYDKIVRQAKKEYFYGAINYDENKSKLDSYTFLEKPLFSREFYDFEKQQHNGVQPNFIINQEGNIVLFPIINFSIEKNNIERIFNSLDSFDVLLIHEINHVIGMHLLDYQSPSNYTIQMGLVENCKDINKSRYTFMTYIDEIFNQNVAKKVTKLLHNKGIYLLDNPDKSQIEDTSLYEMGEFILKDFFKLFYQDILELYNSPGKLDDFYSKIDITEVKHLGILVEEYLKNPNIMDLSAETKKGYENRAKYIMNRIKLNPLKEKIYEIIFLLDLNDLNALTPEKINNAFIETLNLFAELDNIKLKTKITSILLEAKKFALENIDEIKRMEGLLCTNKSNAKMYGFQKKNIFKYLNHKNPLILSAIFIELEKAGINISDIIKAIHSIEYGMINPNIREKIIELFGENFYKTLMDFNEINQNSFESSELLCDYLENSITRKQNHIAK